MKSLSNTSARTDHETAVAPKRRHCLSSFQEELADLISGMALKNFKDLNEMDTDQAKRFGRIISNYSSNLSVAMTELAMDTRVH